MALSPQNLQHLEAAHGFVDLGMFRDANDELEKIHPEVLYVPEVLALRLCIYQKLEKWELMQSTAKKLLQDDPADPQWAINLAYATRRADSIEAARQILLNFLNINDREPLVFYNLACYECQLGDLKKAKEYLDHAFTMEPELRTQALEDEDLEVVWASCRADSM